MGVRATPTTKNPSGRLCSRESFASAGMTSWLAQRVATNESLARQRGRELVTQMRVSQLVIGTDFPYPWTKTAVDLILQTPGLSDADKTAILGGTAATLLGIKA